MKIGYRKKSKPATKEEMVERKAVFIATLMLHAQRKWADWMQRQTERLSPKGKLFLLVMFCVATTTCSVMLVRRSIYKSDGIKYQVGKMQFPSLPKQEHNDPCSRDIIERISRFRHYMDSLSKDQNGIKTYDSILLAHPGLIDSLSKMEQLRN